MIKLIGMTSIDWHRYVDTTNKILGRSPTRRLDELGIRVGSLESFLLSLKEFKKPNNEVEQYKHLYFTFLCNVPQNLYFDINILGIDADYTVVEEQGKGVTFLMTLSIKNLYLLIVQYCTKDTNNDLRSFLNELFTILEFLEFKEIFKGYKKVSTSKGEFYLERKT